jgi:signal transduction histidine kinase
MDFGEDKEIDAVVFEALPEALFLVRGEKVVWANAAAKEMLGVQDLVGKNLDGLLAPGDRHRLSLLEAQRRGGWDLPSTCRLRFSRDHDGRGEVVADVRFGLLEGGGLILSARDITDVTRAEELMGRLAQLSATGSTLPHADALLSKAEPVFEELGWRVGFTELAPGGSITRRMIAPPNDPVGEYGRTLVNVFTPLEKTPIVAEVVRTGRALFLDNLPTLLPGAVGGATKLGESMLRAHLIRSAWCPIAIDGVNTHLLAVTGRDLTEHDFVAVQLFAAQIGAAIHAQRLRSELIHHERLAAVGEMAAIMAHEVRNPLGVIFNALAGLRKEKMPGTAKKLYEIIAEEAERLRRLVTDLLDFSRPSVVTLETIAVRTLLNEAVEAARLDPGVGSMGRTSTRVEVTIADDLHFVETDAALVRRALVNLLVNAVQYVSEEGAVLLDAHLTEGHELHVRVENDGEGMTPEVASRVFEPFFTTRAAGTGLGLAVVRRIVDDLGGRIVLDSHPTKTAFTILLPVKTNTRLDLVS